MSSGPDESSLVLSWHEMDKAIRRHAFPKWAGVVLMAISVVLAATLGLALKSIHDNTVARQQLTAYVDAKVRNECAALELITAVPVPRPADPKANPSREANYRFYTDLVAWETADGCRK